MDLSKQVQFQVLLSFPKLAETDWIIEALIMDLMMTVQYCVVVFFFKKGASRRTKKA